MKVITNITLRVGKGKDRSYAEPGAEIDLTDIEAEILLNPFSAVYSQLSTEILIPIKLQYLIGHIFRILGVTEEAALFILYYVNDPAYPRGYYDNS